MCKFSSLDKFRVLQTFPIDCEKDGFDIPFIENDDFGGDADWNGVRIVNYNNKNSKKILDFSHVVIDFFNNDEVLESVWRDPSKHILRYRDCFAVMSPDYSLSPLMNKNVMLYNVYRNRAVGRWWQENGVRVIPTVQWSDPSTYDFAFSGIRRHAVVAVSTLGCMRNTAVFLDGYNEMMKRLEPRLVVVVGNMIDGIHGRILNKKYADRFLDADIRNGDRLFEVDSISTISIV